MAHSFRRPQPRRVCPFIDMGCGVGHPRSFEQGILFGAGMKFGGFGFESLGEKPEPILKGKRLSNPLASLHGTPRYLRVLTAGFSKFDPNMPRDGVLFPSEHNSN